MAFTSWRNFLSRGLLGLALAFVFTSQPLAAATVPNPPDPFITYFPFIRRGYLWELQQGNPAYLRNYVNTAGCNWMGVVGQAFGMDGRPQLELIIHVEGGGLNADSITGSQPNIGPGAYMIIMGNYPITTTDTYNIQLRTLDSQPLMEARPFPTYGDCNKNLILINFEQRLPPLDP